MNNSTHALLHSNSGKEPLLHANEDINTSLRGKAPSLAKKILCCQCFKKRTLITSKSRKDTWFKLLGNPFKKRNSQDDELCDAEYIDPLKILKNLYTENNPKSLEQLKLCRINPNLDPNSIIRDDLEFFIPQICNYIVFHEEFKNMDLNSFIQDVCQISFFFSHLIYWNLLSLSKVLVGNQEIVFECIAEPLNCIVDLCSEESKNKFLIAYSEIMKSLENKTKRTESIIQSEKTKEFIKNYGTNQVASSLEIEGVEIKASDIEMKNYVSIFNENAENSGFLSTIYFFQDLISVSDKMINYDKSQRVYMLKKDLSAINEKLPAAVYIPFFKNNIRNFVVLNIVIEETLVFSTKKRAPYYLCLEIFRPEEDYDYEKTEMETKMLKSLKNSLFNSFSHKSSSAKSSFKYRDFDMKLSEKKTMKTHFQNIKKKDVFPGVSHLKNPLYFKSNIDPIRKEEEPTPKIELSESANFKGNLIDFEKNEEEKEEKEAFMLDKTHGSTSSQKKKNKNANHGVSFFYGEESVKSLADFDVETAEEKGDFPSTHEKLSINDPNRSIKLHNLKKDIENLPDLSENLKNDNTNNKNAQKVQVNFGEDSKTQIERIKAKSPFKHLRSWALVHMIIKTQDNLKQEQFALQLIYQFYQIFKVEKLKIKLRPYEVLSLGPDCGIMEMVKDCITVDSLKKKIYQQNKNFKLIDFFKDYYGKNLDKARYNFCSSLAGYSLICYFLQIKDRHNGNILLHKDGYIIHIDFGFFLSNMPGKGLEFEKPVAFKLLSEYVEVLGGEKSNYFQTFRKLFYKGFKAIIKHKEKILLLVKMMYSSHGNTLPCFESGEKCIQELEERFSPKNVNDDGELNIFTQNLINSSLDNIRTKWYDKFQYYFQGIFY